MSEQLNNKQTLPLFPADFKFGVGNSDSQCEAYDPLYPDIRDVWYAKRRLQERKQATDFWHRYEEDIRLAQGLGCSIFRFSIAWARVEPVPGQFRKEALDHYSELVDTIIAAGMSPCVTLCHFVWPLHIEERGGIQANEFPVRYSTYVEQVVARLGDRVKLWATFNEPNILAFGYLKPWWERNYFAPPGLPLGTSSVEQIDAVNQLMRNLFLAHTKARKLIKSQYSEAMVGANPAMLGLPLWLQRFMDRNVINLRKDTANKFGRSFSERAYVEHGKIDVLLANFSKTDLRASQLDFAEIYLVSARRILVPIDSALQQINDLSSKRIAVVKGSTAQLTASLLPKNVTLIDYANHNAAILALSKREVDAFIADENRLRTLMQEQNGRFRMLDSSLAEEAYGPAITKGNPFLLNRVNNAVVNFIDSGAWAASYRKHFGEPAPAPPLFSTLATLAEISGKTKIAEETGTNDLLFKIRQRGRIVIGVKDNVPGLGFRDAQGNWTGLEIDLAHAIAAELFGNENAVELVAVSTSNRVPMLRTWFRFFDFFHKIWSVLATISTTNWWHLGMAGKLPDFLCPPECVGQFDYIAFDYYWGIKTLRIGSVMDLINAVSAGRMDKAPVDPDALYDWLKEIGGMFPGAPLYIVENGCVENADGFDRVAYLNVHLKQVQRALAEGVKVAGYLCWSITTNRELGQKLTPSTDFGLYHIDLDTDENLERKPTPAAENYKEIIKHYKV